MIIYHEGSHAFSIIGQIKDYLAKGEFSLIKSNDLTKKLGRLSFDCSSL
ncbi:hypothetical protein [Cytobacillus praedii]